MMRAGKIHIVVALLALFGLSVKAQDFNDDARLWLYLKFDKDLGRHLEAHLVLQNRFDNNVSQYSQGYADFGFTYKFNKHVRVIADYVYGDKRRLNGTYSNIHQLYAGVILKQRAGNFVFTYRNLVQGEMKRIYSREKGKTPLFYERNKITVKYEVNKRWEFYTAEELNLPFYNPRDEISFSRSRTFFGAVYNLSKRSSFEAYFLFQRQLKYEKQAKRDFVYGLTYSHSF